MLRRFGIGRNQLSLESYEKLFRIGMGSVCGVTLRFLFDTDAENGGCGGGFRDETSCSSSGGGFLGVINNGRSSS